MNIRFSLCFPVIYKKLPFPKTLSQKEVLSRTDAIVALNTHEINSYSKFLGKQNKNVYKVNRLRSHMVNERFNLYKKIQAEFIVNQNNIEVTVYTPFSNYIFYLLLTFGFGLSINLAKLENTLIYHFITYFTYLEKNWEIARFPLIYLCFYIVNFMFLMAASGFFIKPIRRLLL